MYEALEESARQVRPRDETMSGIALALLQADAIPG